MLQHEHAPENAPAVYLPVNTPSVSPQELAQAIVRVEERQPGGSQATVDSAVVQQTLARTGLQTTPEQLLEEVQAQRLIAHQDAAMTRHKLHDTPFRLLLAGGITATVAAMFLLFTSYFFLNKLYASNEALAKYQIREAQIAAMPDASQILQKWSYPGAVHNGNSSGGHLNSLSMTTNDSYATVWKYYAAQVGSPSFLPGMRVNADGIVPNLGAAGSVAVNGRAVEYEMASSDTPTNRTMTFTSLDAQSTVSGIITHDPVTHATTIKITSSTPKPLP